MIKTRKAVVRDIDAINELTFEMHNYLGALVGIKLNKQELANEMYENAEDLKNVYVAEKDSEVVGNIAFSKEVYENEFFGKYHHLYHMAVKKEFQRKRVASKLFSTLLRKAKREKVNIVTETFCLNKKALRFCCKMGFKPIETVLIMDNLKKLKFHSDQSVEERHGKS